jgi:hypothetical protein
MSDPSRWLLADLEIGRLTPFSDLAAGQVAVALDSSGFFIVGEAKARGR